MGNLINKIFLTGMVGLGSLGIFGNVKGQENLDTIKMYKYTDITLRILDNNKDKKIDEYQFRYRIGENTLQEFKYKDFDYDGKMDTYASAGYLGSNYHEKSQFLDYEGMMKKGWILEMNPEDTMKHKILIKKLINYPLGEYSFKNKECGSQNILDCLIDIF